MPTCPGPEEGRKGVYRGREGEREREREGERGRGSIMCNVVLRVMVPPCPGPEAGYPPALSSWPPPGAG